MNFKVNWGSQTFNDHFQDAARACNKTICTWHMQKIKDFDENAYHYLMRVDPSQQSRHAFSIRVTSDLLLNNVVETFNSFTLEARDKHVITMLETIRRLLMKKFYQKREYIAMVNGNICPRILMKLDEAKIQSSECIVIPSGGERFEVTQYHENTKTCDLENHTYTCKKWDISGIPYHHACAVIYFKNRQPESFVHLCYIKVAFLKAYKSSIEPVPGPKDQPKANSDLIKPLIIKKQLRRPKKQRIRKEDEASTGHLYRLRR